jgi:hypothetical protein
MPVRAECFSFAPLGAERKKISFYSALFVGSSDSPQDSAGKIPAGAGSPLGSDGRERKGILAIRRKVGVSLFVPCRHPLFGLRGFYE